MEKSINFYDLEVAMWEAAKNRDAKAFLNVVDEKAVMVCGGLRCSGAEYAEYVKEFDLASYEISYFEIIEKTSTHCQIHYVADTKASHIRNADLEGEFHVTSTWKKIGDCWKMIFNMDSRIIHE